MFLRRLRLPWKNPSNRFEGKFVSFEDGPESDGRMYFVAEGVRRWVQTAEQLALIEAPDRRLHRLSAIQMSEIPIGAPYAQPAASHAASTPRDPLTPHAFGDIHEIRALSLEGLLSDGMTGFEIGAGPYPTPVPGGVTVHYFDKRDDAELDEHFRGYHEDPGRVSPMAEIDTRFPDGADFMLAHQVLEHCANPIATLIDWNSHLRDGGIGIISMPHHRYCVNESARLVPPIEHLLLDYALEREAPEFESREHILSSYLAWESELVGFDERAEFARAALDAHRSVDDIHWHAIDDALFHDLILAAGLLDGVSLELLRFGTPNPGDAPPLETSEVFETRGELMAIYRLARVPTPREARRALGDEIDRVRARLLEAARLLDRS